MTSSDLSRLEVNRCHLANHACVPVVSRANVNFMLYCFDLSIFNANRSGNTHSISKLVFLLYIITTDINQTLVIVSYYVPGQQQAHLEKSQKNTEYRVTVDMCFTHYIADGCSYSATCIISIWFTTHNSSRNSVWSYNSLLILENNLKMTLWLHNVHD